ATAELGLARIAREGADVTLVSYGPTVRLALQAAALAEESGVSAEVIDLRPLSPLDSDAVVRPVKKTGRAVVIHEAVSTYGAGAEIAARVSEQAFFHLHAPVLRVGGFYAPYPGAKYEHDYLPNVDRVLDAVDRVVAH